MPIWLVIILAVVAVGAFAAGAAYQRAADAWWRLRSHMRATRAHFRLASEMTGEAIGIVLLAASVLAVAGLIVWSSAHPR